MDNQQFLSSSVPSPSEFIDVQDEEPGSEISHDEWLEASTEMESFCVANLSTTTSTAEDLRGSEMSYENASSETVNLEHLPFYEMDADGGLHYLIGGVRSRCPTPPAYIPPVPTRTHTLDESVVFYEDDGRDQASIRGGSSQLRRPARRGLPCATATRRDEGWRKGDRIIEVYLTDEDVPLKLRKMVESYEASRNERRALLSRRRRNVRVDENDEHEDESVLVGSSISDVLFGGDDSALEFEWSPMASFGKKQEEFHPADQPGPRQPTSCPYEAFRQYWDDDILNHIVTETNRYASGFRLTSPQFLNECDTNVHEILIFFAFWMMLGVIRMPSVSSCFSKNYLLRTNIFRKLFTQKRYWFLNKALHFIDNASLTPDSSKLFSLGPVIDHLRKKFSECYTPSQDITIDESLTQWMGKLSFKQYIKTKAARYGIKTFELCEASTSYMWSFIVYLGKDTPECSSNVLPKTTEIVIHLIRPLLNKGYRVFMDNWFNSPLLARYLKRNQTDCVGTLRKVRLNVPPLIKLAEIAEGHCVARHCGDVAVMAYQDKRTVYTVSTHHGTESVFVDGKPGRPAHYRPVVIDDYNKYMGGVDKKDQMLEPYVLERKRCQKWYKKMFKRLLNVSILNSRIIVGKSTDSEKAHLAFRLELVDKIIQRHLEHAPRQRQLSNRNACLTRTRLHDKHFIIRIPITERGASSSRNSTGRRQCHWCLVHDRRYRKTVYMCDTCEVALCLDGCFKQFHIAT